MAGKDYGLILLATVFVGVFLRVFVLDAARIRTASMADTLLPGDVVLINKLVYGPSTPSTIPFAGIAVPSLRFPSIVSLRCGDVVLVQRHLPSGETVKLVKRVIGLPGDTIAICGGTVFRNGVRLPLPSSARAEGAGEVPPLAVPRAGDVLRISNSTLPLVSGAIMAEDGEISTERRSGLRADERSAEKYQAKNDWFYVIGDNRPNSIDSRVWGFVSGAEIAGRVVAIYWSRDEVAAARGIAGQFGAVRWSRIGTIVR
jgi:signal peptidase I